MIELKRAFMRKRNDYERTSAIVSEVIHQWDPYELISGGAPLDEFDEETARIVTQIPSIHSEDDATRIISRVFSEAFNPEDFTLDKCASAGVLLYRRLTDLHLLT